MPNNKDSIELTPYDKQWPKIIETERLILRRWKDSDIDAYYHINQDPKVIEFLRGPLSM